ncbi:MAG: prolyl-tRNA synthetase associated domain-containing protein [Alphaproteobacteria bacterium]
MITPEQQEQPIVTRLAALGIQYVMHRHPALHTVAESKQLRGSLPGGHIKNLFLRDKKRTCWLVTILEDRQVDLKLLRTVLGARGNLSFGNPDLLKEVLGVDPGAVTPFAVINDPGQRVELVLDQDLLALSPINAHPLHNQATTAIAAADLLRFIRDCGHEPRILDFANLAAPQT